VYRSIEEIQVDLNEWVRQYNHERTYSGKYCYGKTPMQTCIDSIPPAKEKLFSYGVSDGQPAWNLQVSDQVLAITVGAHGDQIMHRLY
jgi:hypothetical protein